MISAVQYILLAFGVFGTLAVLFQDVRDMRRVCEDDSASKSDVVTTLLGKILANVIMLGALVTALRSIGFI